MMASKSIVFFIVSTIALVEMVSGEFKSNSTAVECSRPYLAELEEYLKDMELLHDGKRRFPETFPELKEACGINKKVITMMHNMAEKCMTGFTKNIMQVTIYSIRKSSKSICKKKPTKEIMEFLDAGKCINGGRKQFSKCLHKTQANIMALRRVEAKNRIPLICCETVRAKQCLLDEARNVEECTEKHIDLLQNRYNHVSGNSMNMACGDYTEDSNKCDHMLPPDDVDYDAPPKSFMMAALDLIDLFENDPNYQIEP